MIELFEQSIKEVFNDHFGLETGPCRKVPEKEGYSAHIPFCKDQETFEAQVWIDIPVLKKLSELLLCEENPDEATLEDLTSEVANFIIGHAKMVASDKNLSCSIQTPQFEGKRKLYIHDDTLLYGIDNHCIALQLSKVKNG